MHAPVNHFATPEFWRHYRALPVGIRELADKNFRLLQENPQHPSLHFKRIGSVWTVRVGLHYRAIARERSEGLVWFWIGHHGEYDQFLRR